MSGTLSGGLGSFCRVLECGFGRRHRPAAHEGHAGKGFRHHIQNVGFQPGHRKLTFDKTRDGALFARKTLRVNTQSGQTRPLGFILLQRRNDRRCRRHVDG
jgi:hypothetical protein